MGIATNPRKKMPKDLRPLTESATDRIKRKKKAAKRTHAKPAKKQRPTSDE
jgi:hypothetical protein